MRDRDGCSRLIGHVDGVRLGREGMQLVRVKLSRGERFDDILNG